jgi:ribonuclease HII
MLNQYLNKNLIEVGCDEAGRGCLAGPVVAAAVILNPKVKIKGLDDSKKLSERSRNELRVKIEEGALAFAVGICSPEEVDEINILQASFKSMHKALDQITTKFEHVLVDGNRFVKYKDIDHTCIIKGDAKFQSIAAASILAKTYRDEIMQRLHKNYPEYAWNKNKGYPTKQHRKAIAAFGPTDQHRMTFQLLPLAQGKLFD